MNVRAYPFRTGGGVGSTRVDIDWAAGAHHLDGPPRRQRIGVERSGCIEARRSPDEFDNVLKLGSGELGHHLIDTTLMTAAITVSDTLSAADQRTSGG